MATKTFSGGTDTTWDTGDNWTGGTIPAAADIILVTGHLDTGPSVAITVASATVNAGGYWDDGAGFTNLTVTGAFNDATATTPSNISGGTYNGLITTKGVIGSAGSPAVNAGVHLLVGGLIDSVAVTGPLTLDAGATGNPTTVSGALVNAGTINGGTFASTGSNLSGGVIRDGAFGVGMQVTNATGGTLGRAGVGPSVDGPLTNTGSVTAGTYNGAVVNDAPGVISGGTFNYVPTGSGSVTGGILIQTLPAFVALLNGAPSGVSPAFPLIINRTNGG